APARVEDARREPATRGRAERRPGRLMKVLMLGWEFPPHISGGLGTACLGLTQGLSQHGVEVLFVVPRARGDEDARFVKILGANEIVIEDEVELPPRRVVRERVEEGVDV